LRVLERAIPILYVGARFALLTAQEPLMALRTLHVQLKPAGPIPRDSPDASIAGTYAVEVDSNLTPDEARAAALEAFYEAVEIADPEHFNVLVR